jgi:hypothetical protein
MLRHLFSQNYLFGPNIGIFSRSDKGYFLVGLLMIVVAVGLSIYKRVIKDKLKKHLVKVWRRMFVTIGILGMLWAVLRYELVPFFSMHIVIWVIYLIGLIWILFILKYWFIDYKKERMDAMRDQQMKKYF